MGCGLVHVGVSGEDASSMSTLYLLLVSGSDDWSAFGVVISYVLLFPCIAIRWVCLIATRLMIHLRRISLGGDVYFASLLMGKGLSSPWVL